MIQSEKVTRHKIKLSNCSKPKIDTKSWKEIHYNDTSCKKEDAEIETGNIKIENGAYTIYLSSSNTKIDVSSYFSVPNGKKYEISKTEDFESLVEDVVELQNGENKFYVRIVGSKNVYVFNFIKKRIFTVEYAYSSGEVFTTLQCEEGSILEAPKPTKQGYSIEWDYDFTKAINSDVRITGKWVPNKYKVTISATGCEIDGKEIEVVFGEKLNIEAPSLLGYQFTGWTYNNAFFDSTSEYNIASDIVIKASFSPLKYTINYYLNGGLKNENNWVVSFNVENDDIVLSDPSWVDDSHVFDGWYTDPSFKNKITKISKGTTKNVDVYAKWVSAYKTEVTISAPGLSFDNTKITIAYGDNYDLSSYSKEGFKLLNWTYSDKTLMNKGTWDNKEAKITISPVYEIINYMIDYNLNGGKNNDNNPSTYTINDEVALASPSWDDDSYVFDGWYIDSSFTTPFVSIPVGSVGNFSVYAKWNANVESKDETTKVTILAPEFEVNNESYTMQYGEEYTLPALTKNGHKFLGWNVQNDTKVIPNVGTWNIEAEEIVLVPSFEIIEYSIEYNLNGGNNATTNPTKFTVLEEVTFDNPTWTDNAFEFVGWYTDEAFTNEITGIELGTTENIKLYAKWTRYTTITIVAPGFSCDQNTIKIEFGQDYSLPVLEKTGY